MPDFGGLKRGIVDRAKQASQQVSARVGLEQIGSADAGSSDLAAGAVDVKDGASITDIKEQVARLRTLLEQRRPPPGPVRGRWSIGIGDLLAEHPKIPNKLRGLARTLDRYGGLAITENAIEIDHDSIDWSSVTEIRTRNLVEYLLSDAVNQQLHTVPLPWFPGRGKVLDALSKAVLTLLITVAKEQLDRVNGQIRIPAEIEYREPLRRRRELAPGVLTALVLADPAVSQCLQATAQAHGIVVRAADDALMGTAERRAELLRSKLAVIESRIGDLPGRTAPRGESDQQERLDVAEPSPAQQPALPQPSPAIADADAVAQFRKRKVIELQTRLNACREERLDPARETGNLVDRLRELYFFAPDLRGLVEEVKGLATQHAIADWSRNGLPMDQQPWSRISDALDHLLNEAPLYQRDWTQGAIEPQFSEAISGWIDLAECARRAQAASVRREPIDAFKLMTGAVTVFHAGCMQYFNHLRTAGTENLWSIFNSLYGRADFSMDLFPAVLTYFGADGISVLNRVATEADNLTTALRGYVDQGLVDADA